MDVYLYMPIWPIHGGKKSKWRWDLTDTSCLFFFKKLKTPRVLGWMVIMILSSKIDLPIKIIVHIPYIVIVNHISTLYISYFCKISLATIKPMTMSELWKPCEWLVEQTINIKLNYITFIYDLVKWLTWYVCHKRYFLHFYVNIL